METKQSTGRKPKQGSKTSESAATSRVHNHKGSRKSKSTELTVSRSACPVCGAYYYREDFMFRHALEHFKGVIFFCRTCFRTYDSIRSALDHYDRHDVLTKSCYGVGFFCHICGFTENCENRQEILDHFRLHENDSCISADNKVFECQPIYSSLRSAYQSFISFKDNTKTCDAKFSGAESLFRHVKLHFKMVKMHENEHNDNYADLYDSNQLKDSPCLHCRICSASYFRMDLLFKHVLHHFEGIMFYCRVCFETFKCYEAASEHYNIHNTLIMASYGVSILCHICGFTENTFERSEIVKHLWRHLYDGQSSADQAVFECERVHNNLSSFLLSELNFENGTEACDEKFKDGKSLVMHVRQHIKIVSPVQPDIDEVDDCHTDHQDSCMILDQDVRGSLCKICGAVLTTDEYLFRHVLRHFKGVKFFCWICFLIFENYDLALTHCKGHRSFAVRPYGVGLICHLCGFSEGTNKRNSILEHFWQHQIDTHSPPANVLVDCRSVCAGLIRSMSHKLVFKRGTDTCDATFWSVLALCKHVKEHIMQVAGDTPKALDHSSLKNRGRQMITGSSATETNDCLTDADSVQILSVSRPRQIKTEKETKANPTDNQADSSLAIYSEACEPSPEKQNVQSSLSKMSETATGKDESKCLVGNVTAVSQSSLESDRLLSQQNLKMDAVTSPVDICNTNDGSEEEAILLPRSEAKISSPGKSEESHVTNDPSPAIKCEETLQASGAQDILKPSTKCMLCGGNFARIDVLFKHVFSHYEGVIFYCRVCLETFSVYNEALEHYGDHRLPTYRAYGIGLICHLCGFFETCTVRHNILDHFWQHAKDDDNIMVTKASFKCKPISSSLVNFYLCEAQFEEGTDACDAEFADADSLMTHIIQHALATNKPRVREEIVLREPVVQKRAVPKTAVPKIMVKQSQSGKVLLSDLMCQICGTWHSRSSMLFKHIVSDHFKRVQFFCRVCLETFGNFSHAVNHLKGHNLSTLVVYGISFVCNFCGLVKSCDEYQENMDHLWQHQISQSSGDQAVFKCKSVCSSITSCFRREVYFKEGTETCKAELADITSLFMHVKQHVWMIKHEKRGLIKIVVQDKGTLQEKALRSSNSLACTLCGERLPNYRTLFHHVVLHFQRLLFFCGICFETSRHYKNILVHYRGHGLPLSQLREHVAFVCNLCGMVERCDVYRENCDHLFEHRRRSSTEQPVFECMSVTSCLRHIGECQVYFKPGTEACGAKFALVESLCGHVKSHLRSQKVEGGSADSQVKKNLGLRQIKATDAARSSASDHERELGSVQVKAEKEADGFSRDYLAASHTATKSSPSWSNPIIERNVSSTRSASKVIVQEIAPVAQTNLKPEEPLGPSAPKRFVLEVGNAQDGTSTAGRPTGKSKVKIFTCRVCQKRFVAEHFYRLHLKRTGH